VINFSLLRFLSTRLAETSGRKRFLSFAKLVAFVSVFVGSAAMVLSLAVLEGFDMALHSLAETFTSHIQVRARGELSLSHNQRLTAVLPEVSPEIVHTENVISVNALLYAHGSTEGVIVKSNDDAKGVPYSEQRAMSGRRRVTQGVQKLSSAGTKVVSLGSRLASRLQCTVGDTILLTISSSGDPLSGSFDIIPVRVASLYESGMTQYDDVFVYAPMPLCITLIDTLATAAMYTEVWLRNSKDADRVARSIEEQLRYGVECTSVNDIHRGMFSWIEIQKRPIPLVIGLIGIVAVFNIVTTLLISIVEKTHSYAVLQTLGLPRAALIAIVTLQGFSLGFWGSVSGTAAAVVVLYLQQTFGIIRLDGSVYFVDTLPVVIDPLHAVVVICTATFFSLAATLIPGVIASKVSPVASLRFR
jgi:lipoprotein-releasing system permease protein